MPQIESSALSVRGQTTVTADLFDNGELVLLVETDVATVQLVDPSSSGSRRILGSVAEVSAFAEFVRTSANGSTFPKYFDYLCALELVRLTLLSHLDKLA